MIRPEIRAGIVRWREALAGVAVLALGLWWAATGRGLLAWLGLALALGGVALALAGWQRGRFRTGGGGPGVVQVDEGRLTYYGPLSGGTVAIREIEAVAIDPSGHPPHWVLDAGDERLEIPLTAANAEALFDVFARLPEIDIARVLEAVDRPPAAPATLWRSADAPRLPGPRG